eukprot:CAMPEP_0115127990 /NCGR_PEP_ID=MMETSP0227-20121206/50804_1 /TAXON_ID=89957 /ORGANISM="Polarella glacialis, Strain CCMP 1383" /LENGTH=301 /DNA_ID=CAMNT_0002532333 /DNA_START=81 /DNA_END=986 /DNA_ORIENTATION=-
MRTGALAAGLGPLRSIGLLRRVLSTSSGASSGQRPALVLAHGFLGGRTLPGSTILYFRGVEEDLRSRGYDVLTTSVPPTSPVALRAKALQEQIMQWEDRRGRRVAILAHSMGGLDARYAISKLGGDALVSSLLTVSTPHRGSPLADLLLGLGDASGLASLLQASPLQAMADLPDGGRCLSSAAAQEFNSEVADSPDVRYFSVGGDRSSILRTSPELIPGYSYILNREGPNDGAVSVQSARWGKYCKTLDMDHFHQINFPLPHRWLTGAPQYSEVLDEYRNLAAIATSSYVAQGIFAGTPCY